LQALGKGGASGAVSQGTNLGCKVLNVVVNKFINSQFEIHCNSLEMMVCKSITNLLYSSAK